MHIINLSRKYLAKYQTLLKLPNLIKTKGIYKIILSNYEDSRKVIEDGKSYCAVSIFVPTEILSAMNVHFLPLEPVTATAFQLLVAAREVDDVQKEIEEILPSNTSCCNGHWILGLYERGIIPLPKYIIACSHMCDDSLKAYNFISRYYSIPIFIIDVPYYNDDNAVSYLTSQLWNMVGFICQAEGISFDLDALRSAISISNRTNYFRHKIFTMTKDAPTLFRISENLPIYPLYTKFGRRDIEEIYAELAEEVQKRIEVGKRASEDSCYRILWLGMIPLASPHLLSFLNSIKFGFPMTELMFHSDFEEIDVRDPFQGLSQKMMNYPLVGYAQNRIDKIDKIINDFCIEGVIHFNHRACIAFNGDNFILSEYLKKKGIPLLVLEGDIGNKLITSIDKLKEALLNFRNILEEHYGRR